LGDVWRARCARGLTPGLTADPGGGTREAAGERRDRESVHGVRFRTFHVSAGRFIGAIAAWWWWCATIEGTASGGGLRAGGVTRAVIRAGYPQISQMER